MTNWSDSHIGLTVLWLCSLILRLEKKKRSSFASCLMEGSHNLPDSILRQAVVASRVSTGSLLVCFAGFGTVLQMGHHTSWLAGG
jgi:hypothetical protein